MATTVTSTINETKEEYLALYLAIGEPKDESPSFELDERPNGLQSLRKLLNGFCGGGLFGGKGFDLPADSLHSTAPHVDPKTSVDVMPDLKEVSAEDKSVDICCSNDTLGTTSSAEASTMEEKAASPLGEAKSLEVHLKDGSIEIQVVAADDETEDEMRKLGVEVVHQGLDLGPEGEAEVMHRGLDVGPEEEVSTTEVESEKASEEVVHRGLDASPEEEVSTTEVESEKASEDVVHPGLDASQEEKEVSTVPAVEEESVQDEEIINHSKSLRAFFIQCFALLAVVAALWTIQALHQQGLGHVVMQIEKTIETELVNEILNEVTKESQSKTKIIESLEEALVTQQQMESAQAETQQEAGATNLVEPKKDTVMQQQMENAQAESQQDEVVAMQQPMESAQAKTQQEAGATNPVEAKKDKASTVKLSSKEESESTEEAPEKTSDADMQKDIPAKSFQRPAFIHAPPSKEKERVSEGQEEL